MSIAGSFRLVHSLTSSLHTNGWMSLLQHQPYSMYKPFVREPSYNLEQLQAELESGEAKKKQFLPIKAARNDHNVSVFHDEITRKVINLIMEKGHKEIARNLVETAFMKVKQIQLSKYYNAATDEERSAIELNPVTILHQALENCKPILQLTPIKRGGSTYQVPVPVSDKRATFLAMKWMILESREKERKVHFPERFAAEMLDAFNNTGKVVKRKQDLHRQCEANRAYAHYRWG